MRRFSFDSNPRNVPSPCISNMKNWDLCWPPHRCAKTWGRTFRSTPVFGQTAQAQKPRKPQKKTKWKIYGFQIGGYPTNFCRSYSNPYNGSMLGNQFLGIPSKCPTYSGDPPRGSACWNHKPLKCHTSSLKFLEKSRFPNQVS